MKKIKVCCFCENWESGGIESFLYNVLLHLDFNRMDVDIVTSCQKKSIFTQTLEAKGVNFFELSGRQRDFLKNSQTFWSLLREKNYDVVHFNLFQGLALYYVRQAKRAGVPVRIVHSHNTSLRESRTRWIKLLVHRIGSMLFTGDATELWACSTAAARFLFTARILKKRSFRYIPNGIETELFKFNQNGRAEMRSALKMSDCFVIGNIGRLCYQKNQEFLLEVFAKMIQKRPESRLLLIGAGEQEHALKEKAVKMGIANRVIFYGETCQVERLLWSMDVFLLPSRFEGLGIVAIEAQATGLPTLCSEYVPQEANITNWFKMIPLSGGVSKWSDALLTGKWQDTAREKGASWVRKAGFEISEVSKSIQESYLQ